MEPGVEPGVEPGMACACYSQVAYLTFGSKVGDVSDIALRRLR